jgi:hypothetical protein
MIKLDHTPGRWSWWLIIDNIYGVFTDAPSCSFAICAVKNNMANARLISCAPEMLEDLIKEAQDNYNLNMGNPMYQGRPPILFKNIIEKATGKKIEELIK